MMIAGRLTLVKFEYRNYVCRRRASRTEPDFQNSVLASGYVDSRCVDCKCASVICTANTFIQIVFNTSIMRNSRPYRMKHSYNRVYRVTFPLMRTVATVRNCSEIIGTFCSMVSVFRQIFFVESEFQKI